MITIFILSLLIKNLIAHVGFVKNVKALDPHLQYPDVWYGEVIKSKYLQHDTSTMMEQQESRGPEPGVPPAEDPTVNPVQSFLGQFAGKRRKLGFFGQ